MFSQHGIKGATPPPVPPRANTGTSEINLARNFQEGNSETQRQKAPRLRIRMYRHGLGDCILLRFGLIDGSTFKVLIDCGLIGVATDPKPKMEAVVRDITECCSGSLDLVVMTHEHWDHASGFSKQQARSIFDSMDIREVWYAWTEDPGNPLGKKLRAEREEKVEALELAARALSSLDGHPVEMDRGRDICGVLSFFGFDSSDITGAVDEKQIGEKKKGIRKTREAFDYLANRAGVKVSFREPATAPISIARVPGLRIYALGPPQDEGLIKKSRPTRKGREVYEFQEGLAMAVNLRSAFVRLAGGFTDDCCVDCPFEKAMHATSESDQLKELREATWDAKGQEWRRIELDWTQAAESLAIDLDSHTNNTCLALAFELVDTGEVFLFPGDAQVGNWLSWQNLNWTVRDEKGDRTVSARDLLGRTVFYKVGHHGSHNATLRDFGLELMNDEGLIAYVPVFESEAKKSRWNEMPFGPLLQRLQEKTRGRLLRADDEAPPDDAALSCLSQIERERFRQALEVGDNRLYYEISFH